MKFLVVASTQDLRYRLGCTPSWWQLWKALHEVGHEVVVIPYLGDPVEALWWRTYPNPCRNESLLINRYLDGRKARGRPPSGTTVLSPLFDWFIRHDVRPKWRRHLEYVLEREKDVDAVLFMSVPVGHIAGLATEVVKPRGIPAIFYDGDMPSILPEYAAQRGLRFNSYDGADLSEYDLFLVNSEAVIPTMEAAGAKKVLPFHYAVDADLFTPVDVPKDIDVAYFALNSIARESWMTKLIAIPSRALAMNRFCVGGGPFDADLGKAESVGPLTYSQFRRFCCRSRINLNITSWTHATARGTSTSRPFELAAFGSCIVSQPYDGIEAWFEPEKEIVIVQDEHDAIKRYRELLADPAAANEMGRRARARVLKEHTYRHRAQQLVREVGKLS